MPKHVGSKIQKIHRLYNCAFVCVAGGLIAHNDVRMETLCNVLRATVGRPAVW